MEWSKIDKKLRYQVLKNVLALHKKWSDSLGMEGERLSLSGAHLCGADFDGADLRCASFDGADLEDAIFRRASLRRAFLNSANLELVDFHGARVRWHDLINITLVEAPRGPTSPPEPEPPKALPTHPRAAAAKP